MKTKLMTMAVGLLMALPAMAQQFDAPVGWASVEGGTTGSGNRNPVVVETVEQLKKHGLINMWKDWKKKFLSTWKNTVMR